MPHLKSVDICAYCTRTEIECLSGNEVVDFVDAPPIGFYTTRICADCQTILTHAIRLGAMALRTEFTHMRQLDLFEGPTDRVIRRLTALEGKDAPSDSGA